MNARRIGTIDRVAGAAPTPASLVGRGRLLVACWVAALVVVVAFVLAARRLPEPSPVAGLVSLLVLLALNVALVRWLGPAPTDRLAAARVTQRTPFVAAFVVVAGVLVPLGLLGVAVLPVLALAALTVLVVVRPPVGRAKVRYALALAVIASLGGALTWLATGSSGDLAFAALQLPLVALTLVAGWSIVDRVGGTGHAVGASRTLRTGAMGGLRSFGFGLVFALPWALGNIVNGPFPGDDVRTVWQPLQALQPGVAEEAWARVFVIPVLYLVFARVARAGPALLAAAILGTFWFAFLHTPANPVVAVLVALIYVAPMTALWLRRDLETAMGFHVGTDLVRFAAAYVTAQGMWFI